MVETRAESGPQPIFRFHTTPFMEAMLDEAHEKEIKKARKYLRKQARETGIPRLSAKVAVGCRPVTFLVDGGVVTCTCCNGPCPRDPQSGGETYEIVPKFASQVADFQKRHTRYEASAVSVSLPPSPPRCSARVRCPFHQIQPIIISWTFRLSFKTL